MRPFFSLIGVELSALSRREKLISAMGGLISIAFLTWFTRQTLGLESAMCLITSMAASAVLLFAVPHGQLSQPWPLVGGSCISAAIGVLCFQWIPWEWVAAGSAVGLSILAMHQLKCLHPPGASAAFTAVVGGPAITELGMKFVIFPVLINVLVMLTVAILINWSFPWRRYPAALARRAMPLKPHPTGAAETVHEDIVKALKNLDSFIDITEDDLIQLSRMLAREREARVLKEARRQRAETTNEPAEEFEGEFTDKPTDEPIDEATKKPDEELVGAGR